MMTDDRKESLRHVQVADIVADDVSTSRSGVPATIGLASRKHSQWPLALAIGMLFVLLSVGIWHWVESGPPSGPL